MPFPQSLASYVRQSAAFKAHDTLDRLPSISAPAHIIVGEEDIYTPLRYSIDIANAIPGATLAEIHSVVGHDGFLLESAQVGDLLGDHLTHPGQPAIG